MVIGVEFDMTFKVVSEVGDFRLSVAPQSKQPFEHFRDYVFTPEAAIEAARLRLRPILMTSFAFIFGVTPLIVATGAGAEMRQALGTVVFFGMIGVTFFGVLLTPVF